MKLLYTNILTYLSMASEDLNHSIGEIHKLEQILNKLLTSEVNEQISVNTENLTQPDMNTLEPVVSSDTNPWYQYLCVEKMDPTAMLPAANKSTDAGYDLHSFENYTIFPGGAQLVSTKIKIAIPPGYYGRIASRSGLAAKSNIEVGAGVIDQGYQGEILVLLRNFGKDAYLINKNDRIAQIIISPYIKLPVQPVNSLVELFGSSDRGSEGFGKSGK